MPKKIWDKTGNPPKYVSDLLRSRTGSSETPFMELKGQATSVARIALSYMMMALSRIRVASLWVTSMTNSENTLGTYATLRFAGDALDPDEISSILRTQPTRAYRKGQKYSPGPRSPEVIGKTGIWYF